MAKSASDLRRERTLARIIECAQQLADEHGLDGFTMDELADEVGVSRRTLFNYVPSKVDAVLGPADYLTQADIDSFLAGEPTGNLASDVRELTLTLLRRDGATQESVLRTARLRQQEPILKALTIRGERVTDQLAELVRHREPDLDPRVIHRFAVLTMTVLSDAVDSFVLEPERGLDLHFAQLYDDTRALFA